MKHILLLVLFAVTTIQIFGSKQLKTRPKLLHGRPSGGFVPQHKHKHPTIGGKSLSEQQYIIQPQDHFDHSNFNTFRQRYWYNDEWWGKGIQNYNAVFLLIGGDAPVNPDDITGGLLMTQYGSEIGALFFLLEHRYYGLSNVTTDLSTPNLKYLSSRQALADISSFITTMNVLFNLKDPVWVTWGGSYAGALTAWSLQLYPNQIRTAIASSAMVQAVVNNTDYMDAVQQIITASNPACASYLHDGLVQIDNLINSGNRDDLQKLMKGFQLCEPLNANNKEKIAYFYSKVMDPYLYGVQYGNYRDLCNVLTNESYTTLTNMYTVNRLFNNYTSCMDVDYVSLMEHLQNTDLDNSDRVWFYQTCTEFGFYQTTDNSPFYGNILPVDWYINQCKTVFGIDSATVYSNINQTNNFYGGQNGYKGSAILPYGTADPWYALGIKQNPSYTGYTLVIINGSSHCEDMAELDPNNDSQQLQYAKQNIVGTAAFCIADATLCG